jgi:hypothetical protein
MTTLILGSPETRLDVMYRQRLSGTQAWCDTAPHPGIVEGIDGKAR